MPAYASLKRGTSGYVGVGSSAPAGSGTDSRRAALLIYLGYTVNTFGYCLFATVVFDSCTWLLDRSEAAGIFRLHGTQRHIIEAILTGVVSFVWTRFLTQRFDGDVFSHVLYWRYRLINTWEMLSRSLGGLSAGILFGLFYMRLYYPGVVGLQSASVGSNGFSVPSFADCPDCKTFSEMIAGSLPKAANGLGMLRNLAVAHLPTTVASLDLLRRITTALCRVAWALEQFIFEFCFCMAMYLVLSVTLVADHVVDCCALYIVYKRLVAFTANTYLRDIGGTICLDASVSVRRFVADRNITLLCLRLLANFVAVFAAECFFNPMQRLRHCDFAEIYGNVSDSKKQAMLPNGGATEYVTADVVSYADVGFTPLPDTHLGRWLERFALRPAKCKEQ
ncbi:DNA polymerase III subunit beta [Babesia ovata]|uniref:DNA polymerase III subunit beta n=1 Tax=Babesia ovata TaxID=189622 RepID=A0A2H6K6Y0_9APIC|nr:DNA polymerase III subunit beta [Babesia ovata]GBE58728.1 DNA polymerase III subunit beta [Babesia ovata]